MHIHTDVPQQVTESVERYGTVTHLKVDDMERQHHVLVIDSVPHERSVVVVAPGEGFEAIVRELGAEVTVPATINPSVRDLLLAINKTLSDEVVLFVNDKNVEMAAREAVERSEKHVSIVPTPNIVTGIAGLFALRALGDESVPAVDWILRESMRVRAAQLFFAGKDALHGSLRIARGKPVAQLDGELFVSETVKETLLAVVKAMGGDRGALLTLYYGGAQRERDAKVLADAMREAFPNLDVEYYYGGMNNAEYWIALDD